MAGRIRENVTLDLEGVGRVQIWENPENPQVVLLHGFMQSARSWGGVAPLLSQHYEVVAPDLLGHGDSRVSTECDLSLDSYVENLKWLIDVIQNPAVRGTQTKKRPLFLVGYSLGGRIAASFAVQHPNLVDALVLESAGLGPRNKTERQQREEKTNRMVDRLEASMALDPDRPLDAFVDWWEQLPLFASQHALSQEVRESIRKERLANDAALLRRNLLEAGQHTMSDLRPALVNLNKPVLYLVGESDAAYNEVARSLMRAWALDHQDGSLLSRGSVQVDVVAGAGHNIHLERPEQYVRILEGFFAQAAGCPGCSA